MSATFAPLHTHSHYSLLRALPKIPALVAAAKAAGCEALALTDLDALYGTIEFYKEATLQGIKPIVGLDAHVGEGRRVLLLVKNEVGYKNLLALVSEANMAAEGSPPLFPLSLIAERKEGLIAIIPALRGGVAQALRARDQARAQHLLQEYQGVFGAEDTYLEIGLYEDIDGHDELMRTVHTFAQEHGVPAVAGQEIFYLEREDRLAWNTMKAIENKEAAEEEDEATDADFSFPTSERMQELFAQMPEVLAETLRVAERCTLTLALGSWIFPRIDIPAGSTYDEELRAIVQRGIKERDFTETPELRTRIEYELKVILDKGFAPYFLVVSDLLQFARRSGILTTTRGSAGGSLVSYLAGITNVDPIFYKLPFERFLNPERPKAPDIDMDFADNRRDEVIEYARQKYGKERVAQIGTFGTMLARGVVRDVARALRYPYGLGDRIAKEIPLGQQGFPMTLERALEENTQLSAMYKAERETKEVIDLGRKMEGCARHISVHAAGVIMAPTPLVGYAPIQLDPKGGKIITQYDMYSITDEYGGVGLLKFDFLGIRNLAILAHSVELVAQTRGLKVDIEKVPLDDTKTFEMLARGETEGTFQLNGSGMTRYLKELQPSTIHDINAMVALFRPGPMEAIPTYIERKQNPALVTYLDPRLKEILDRSYGVITYQDDVLLIAVNLGGYSWLEADTLRKAMGKKIPAVMLAEKEKLVKGFISYGKLSPSNAEKLWKLIEPFAAYGFGKAHAASYGKVAYQTAYMKANYPVEYMAAVLTAESGNIDTVSIMVRECKRMGIPVLPPDVNQSFGDFTVILGEPDAIRFGLYSIKNFGSGVADAIIKQRKENGPFVSLSDFLQRVEGQGLNKRGLESLIQCGALDSLGERGTMLGSLDLLLEYQRHSAQDDSQDSLFGAEVGASDLKLPPAPDTPMAERLVWEKELLGLWVSGHPLDKHKELLDKRPMTLKEMREKIPPGATAVIAGMVSDIRTILTRGGDQMAFIKISDFDDTLEAVVFPKIYSEFRALVEPERCIALKGRLSNRNGELSLIAEKIKAL